MKPLYLFLIFPLLFFCQKQPDLEAQVLAQDFSKILTAKKIQIFDDEKNPEFFGRPEPLGYIGDDFERLYIHFWEIKKDIKNPKLYLAKGKTKVKGMIRDFSGTMEISSLSFKKDHDAYSGFMTGTANFKVTLREDRTQTATGVFSGKLSSGFLLKDGKILYDTLYFYADIFANNTFTGTWTSYKTGKSKKVRFGDFHIPDSGDLDIGAGEFSPDPKYHGKGWKNYRDTGNWWK